MKSAIIAVLAVAASALSPKAVEQPKPVSGLALSSEDVAVQTVLRNATLSSSMELGSIKCDVCHYALKKAYSIGCDAGAGFLADLCLDFAPLCEEGLKILCEECESHCDVDHLIDEACDKVHLC